MAGRECCCIPAQQNLESGCTKPAEYQVWFGDNPTPDNFTESCAEHLEAMLDDSVRFEILRIPQAA